jgi:hypothetical protein
MHDFISTQPYININALYNTENVPDCKLRFLAFLASVFNFIVFFT